MVNENVILKIEILFIAWYHIHMLDSTGFRGKEEKNELIKYCSEHIEEFKKFAKDTLAHPQYCNHAVANLCQELLPDIAEVINPPIVVNENFWVKIKNTFNDISNAVKHFEYFIWNDCNIWLNYFNGTKDVEYYNDFMDFREYEHKHFIPWCPNEEDDPNPTYEEFIANREKYKI